MSALPLRVWLGRASFVIPDEKCEFANAGRDNTIPFIKVLFPLDYWNTEKRDMESESLLTQQDPTHQLAASNALVQIPQILKAKSCIACRKRKVRCDRKVPCNNCARWSIDCVYPSPIRTCVRPRKKPIVHTEWTSGSEDQLYRTRINVLESRICQLTAALNVQGNTLRSMGETENQIRPLSFTWPQVIVPFYPPMATAQVCWLVFLDYVDPLVKVLYRPSAYRMLQRITLTPDCGREGEHALVLAMYLACICAMKETDVEVYFHMMKTTAITTYRSATEQALTRAGFITTNDMSTLQALVLFISFSIYQREQKSAWTLAGLARRLDYSQGKGHSLFEDEIRRRLWWQLWYLDHRATEDYRGKETVSSNLVPSQDGMPLPLNCCDSDLDPNMIGLAAVQLGWTEMSFSLIRFDTAYTRCIIESDQPWIRKLRAIQSCQRRLQVTYLMYCDGSQPIHWLAQHVSYVLTTEMWMNLYNNSLALPGEITSAERNFRNRLFCAAIDILDIPYRLDKEPQAKMWEWLLGAYFQYAPLKFLLHELLCRWDDLHAEQAWDIAQRAFQRWPENVRESTHGVIITELMARVRTMKHQLTHEQQLGSPLFGLRMDFLDMEGIQSGISVEDVEDSMLTFIDGSANSA